MGGYTECMYRQLEGWAKVGLKLLCFLFGERERDGIDSRSREEGDNDDGSKAISFIGCLKYSIELCLRNGAWCLLTFAGSSWGGFKWGLVYFKFHTVEAKWKCEMEERSGNNRGKRPMELTAKSENRKVLVFLRSTI